MKEVKPYSDSDLAKKKQVEQMFNTIAPKYDFLNHLLSFGIDKRWRSKAIRMISKYKPVSILDVATGTGDFAIAALKTGATRITGVDLSQEMVAVGQKKIEKLGLQGKIKLEVGDSESLKYEDSKFDLVTVAFGVRNFENLQRGLDEIYRVLKPGGTLCVLEFSNPRNPVVKFFYNLYSKHLMPFLGGLFAGDRSAYTYLPESVLEFPDGQRFLTILKQSGFAGTEEKRLTFGVATIYTGKKP